MSKKSIKIIIIKIQIIASLFHVKSAYTETILSNKFPVMIKGNEIFVEVADSEEERKRGLMWRKKLNNNAGMLFVFKDSSIRYFWMKNTFIRLDMAFVDANMVIKTIRTTAKTNDSTIIYSSFVPVQYVLEVNAGWFEQHNIEPGDTITFDKTLLMQETR